MLIMPFYPAAPMLRARLREARGGAGHTAETEQAAWRPQAQAAVVGVF